MTTTVNVLGDTRQEQWLNAISIYKLAIESNLADVREYLELNLHDDGIEESRIERIDVALKTLQDFSDEMSRLVRAEVNEVQAQKCPKCGEVENVEAGHVEVDGNIAWHTTTCLACGCEYREVYRFQCIETDDGACD